MELLEKIKEIQILRPQSGDTILVNVNKEMKNEEMIQIGKELKKLLYDKGIDNISILMSNSDIKIEIIRKE